MHGGTWMIWCHNEECHVRVETVTGFPNQPTAAAAWNTRHPATPPAVVAALVEALEPFAGATILPTGAVVAMDRHWFDNARAALARYHAATGAKEGGV